MEEREEDQEELKKKLLRRVGIAGIAIIVLLGGLTLLEKMVKETPVPIKPPAAVAPAPAMDASVEAQTETKTAGISEEPAPAQPGDTQTTAKEEPKNEPRAEPEETETPLAPLPKEVTPSQRIVIKPPSPAVPAKKAPGAKNAPAEAVATAPAAPPSAAPPVARTEGVAPQASIAHSYRLQMGVFTSAAHAEELQAKLEKAGIPSYLETRVQVGPFKTQKEANAAREKLKALGLGTGMLIPPQKR